jgi:lysozyme
MMEYSEHGLLFTQRWETYVGYVYDDKVPMHQGKYPEYQGGPVKGTLTIGFGHTKAAHAVVDMSVGAKMSLDEAHRVLREDISPCVSCANRTIKVKVTQGQFDAVVDFIFNCGEGAWAKSSILRKLNRGDYVGARAALDLYVYSGGEKMRGLQRRRDAEQELWDTGNGAMPGDGEVIEHPAEVDHPITTPVHKSTEAITAAAQTIGGATGGASQTVDAWDLADKAIDAKSKAEALGVEPIKLFDKINGTLSILVHQPAFWFCVAVVGCGVYLFLRRRWRLLEGM